MNRIRVLIVDDEPWAREGLHSLLRRDPELEVVGQAGDGAAAVEAIRGQRPDLVLLDVEMPRLGGFEALALIPEAERPVVIFVTAYQQHAVRAFEICALDYLLKPYTDERFFSALKRAKETIRRGERGFLSQQVSTLLDYVRRIEKPMAPALSATERNERLVMKAQGALHFLPLQEVLWLEAQRDFVKVQTVSKHHLVREALHALEQRLDPARFLRIHRSFVVNIAHVNRVETALYGDYSVFMSDGTKLRLSRSYRSNLDHLVGHTATP